MATISPTRQRAILRKYSHNIKFLMMVLSVFVIVLTLPKQAKFMYEIEKGRIWTQNDLVSPYNFAILKTPQEIDNDRHVALASITPVYQLHADIEQAQLDTFKNAFELKWHASGLDDRKKQAYLAVGTNLLKNIYETGLFRPNPKYQQNGANYPVTVLDKNIATDKNTGDLFTRQKALDYCSKSLDSNKGIDKSFLLDLIINRLQINLTY